MSGTAPTDVAAPETLEDALAALADGRAWTPLAGGTDVLARLDAGQSIGDRVLSLHGLRPELRYVAVFGERVKVGALATFRDVARATALLERLPMLARAARHVGAAPLQHRATIGGNLAVGTGGCLAVWSVLEATVELRSTAGFRRVPFARFFAEDGGIDRRPTELITAVQALIPPTRVRQFFDKSDEPARTALAGLLDLDRGMVKDVRIALGSTALAPMRAPRTEDFLRGKKLDAALVDEAFASLQAELHAPASARPLFVSFLSLPE